VSRFGKTFNPNKRSSMFLRKFVLTLLAAAAPALLAQTTTTSSTYTTTQNLPPIGLASTETAQINAVNVAAESSGGTAASCTGSISFLNSSGAVIGTATPYTLGTNQLKSVSVAYAAVGESGRAEIRGVVTQTGTRPSDVPCELLVSLETYDSTTLVTHVYLNAGTSSTATPLGGGGPGH
jgi:hypothetical protein